MADRYGLPEVIAEVVEIAGLDAARLLAQAKGGQEVYIPAKVLASHWLAKLVGLAAAQKIAEHFAESNRDGRPRGRRLIIPMARFRADAVMVRAIEGGHSANKVALMTGRHKRTVHRARAKIRSGGMGPLFD